MAHITAAVLLLAFGCRALATAGTEMRSAELASEGAWHPREHKALQPEEASKITASVVWQPKIQEPPDATWPTHSEHRCVGTPLHNITCQFKNLLYDKWAKSFVYVPADPPPSDIEELRGLRFFGNTLKLRVDGIPFPARENCTDEVEPSFLYNMFVPASFAHIVRDNLLIMHANLVDLGLQDVTYRIVVWTALNYNASTNNALGTRILQKYSIYAGSGVAWFQDYMASHPFGRWTLWRDFVFGTHVFVGDPPFRPGEPMINRWGGCSSPYMRWHRDDAYARVGIVPPPPPVAQHPVFKVLFHDKLVGDKRRIVNIAELVPSLRRRFPHVQFDSKVVSLLNPREQMLELSSTSIFVSPHGSSSFRMMYLPDGCQVITAGASERFPEEHNNAHGELNNCFDHVPYLTQHRYHCTEADETIVRHKMNEGETEASWNVWWNTDKRLRADKLGDLISNALRNIEAARLEKE